MVTVEETSDQDTLRRWMMKPSVLRKTMVGLPPMTYGELDERFHAAMAEPGRHFLVRVDGAELGVILAFGVGGHWDLHLCLQTPFWHTRPALKQVLEKLGGTVHAKYHRSNRAVNVLLNDVGFSRAESDGIWVERTYCALTGQQ